LDTLRATKRLDVTADAVRSGPDPSLPVSLVAWTVVIALLVVR